MRNLALLNCQIHSEIGCILSETFVLHIWKSDNDQYSPYYPANMWLKPWNTQRGRHFFLGVSYTDFEVPLNIFSFFGDAWATFQPPGVSIRRIMSTDRKPKSTMDIPAQSRTLFIENLPDKFLNQRLHRLRHAMSTSHRVVVWIVSEKTIIA